MHLLLGIIVGYRVQHINYKKLQHIHEQVSDKFIDTIEPHIEHLPFELKKLIDIKKMKQPLNLHFDLSSILLVAYIWEAFEHYFELGEVFPQFSHWIPGQEHWLNRLILDPLMLIIGYGLARSFPKLLWPTMVVSAVLFCWLVFF
ncbi:MAG: hypothetical protein H6765_07440 [Candidatus Peribacteria bacterium]|nr:MAG: hypothetical protein H6765_07440 [Candidatus Peribacteria bacterium]